jgi:hypothetical protein
MYFSHAFRKTLLGVDAGSGVLDTSTSATSALTAGELGLYTQSFSPITFAANSIGTGYTKPFYIVQGSYYKTAGYSDTIGTHGGYQESVKSKMINPKYITRLFWIAAKAPRQQVVQIPVTCGLTCDTTYRLRVDVKGSPALRFLSHNLYRVLDSYTGCCSTTNPGFVKDPVATIVNWKEQLNASPYFNNMVQARAFALKTTNTTTAADATSISTTAATFVPSSFTGIYVGQRVIGDDVPANAYVTDVDGTTDITISYPTQATAPAASVFNAKSLKELAQKAGFNEIIVGHRHGFGISNTIKWLNERKPAGLGKLEFITPEIDFAWVKMLEKTGMAELLHFELVKN